MKRYVRGHLFDEGILTGQVVPGGYIYMDKSNEISVFVPDSRIQVFDSQEELDAYIDYEKRVAKEWEIYNAPLSEGEEAWISVYKERNPTEWGWTIEKKVRDLRLTGEPLIYSFGEKQVNAEDAQPMVGKRSWWERLWGLD